MEQRQDAFPEDSRVCTAVADRGSLAISVTVPSIAILKVDGEGRVVAAMTNTGSAPGTSDQMWLMRLDGALEPAPASVASRHWSGDFSEPGRYVVQSGSSSVDDRNDG